MSVSALAFALVPILLVAQRPAASVQGDVYIVMQNGDTKRGAGRTVSLVPDRDSLHNTIQAVCVAHYATANRNAEAWAAAMAANTAAMKARVDSILSHGVEDTAAVYRTDRVADSTKRLVVMEPAIALSLLLHNVQQLRVAEAPAGMSAHFRFPAVQSGAYLIVSSWPIGEHHYVWWKHVTLRPGVAATQDLDNESIVTLEDLCHPFRSQ